MAKNFKNIDNPAFRFISEADAEPQAQSQTPPTTEKRVKETKSKRLNLLVFPSVYKACKEESDRTGESVNEIINNILKKYFTKEK